MVFAIAGAIYDADGDFDSANLIVGPTLSTNAARDSETDIGFRGKASLALRANLGDRVQVSVFGGIDNWSDVPYSKLPNPTSFPAQSPAHIATDDVLDLKAGIKLTLFLDALR